MNKHLSELATKCQGVAQCLSYNDDDHQAAAKHLLLEASHALDSQAVSTRKVLIGLVVVNARGKRRLLTRRERLAVWLLRGKTEVRP